MSDREHDAVVEALAVAAVIVAVCGLVLLALFWEGL